MRRALALLALTATLGAAPPQSRTGVEVQLPNGPSLRVEGPQVRANAILSDGELQELLRNGFPARMHYRVELWSEARWFNDFKGSVEWDVVVKYDPLAKDYQVARRIESDSTWTPLGRFGQFTAAATAAERSYLAPISPPSRGGRYYYDVTLDVEMLSLSDLDELELWLKGEARQAVRGKRNPGTAVTRGVRTLMVRLLGAERRHYEARSATFRI